MAGFYLLRWAGPLGITEGMRTLLHGGVWLLGFAVVILGVGLGRAIMDAIDPTIPFLVKTLFGLGIGLLLGAWVYSFWHARLPAKRAPKQEVPWR